MDNIVQGKYGRRAAQRATMVIELFKKGLNAQEISVALDLSVSYVYALSRDLPKTFKYNTEKFRKGRNDMLDTFKKLTEEYGRIPTYQEVGARLGKTKQSIHYMFHNMKKRGIDIHKECQLLLSSPLPVPSFKEPTFEELVHAPKGTVYGMGTDPENSDIRWLILRGPASLCAYIGVPEGNALCHYGFGLPLRVHGGITFAGSLPSHVQQDDGVQYYWFGWDYGHYTDQTLLPEILHVLRGKKWSISEVRDEVDEALKEFKNLY